MGNTYNVVCDKKTGQVMVIECNGCYKIHNDFELLHFEGGVEPIFTRDKNGLIYLVPNAVVYTSLK